MSDSIKIREDSICANCNSVPAHGQCIQCFNCKSHFHAVCEITDKDAQVGTKTLVTCFLAASTKANFKFFCDSCLTNMEINIADGENHKINQLEKKVDSLENKIDEISTLLKSPQILSKRLPSKNLSIWNDKDKLATVKAPPSKSVLIIKKTENIETDNANKENIENTIMTNNIPVSKSFKNRTGDLVLVCESTDSRDELKNLVASANDQIVMNTPSVKRPSVSIVGLPREYKKEEVLKMLVMQNGYIKQFSNINNIEDHIDINTIRPLRNNPDKYQVFATVSNILREGFQHHNNKVTLGLISCRVYDRYNIKRCYNCQNFGHFAKDCSTPDTHTCGKCSAAHKTIDCSSYDSRCINCVRNELDQVDHQTSSFNCPSVIKEQELMRKKTNTNHLNLTANVNPPFR